VTADASRALAIRSGRSVQTWPLADYGRRSSLDVAAGDQLVTTALWRNPLEVVVGIGPRIELWPLSGQRRVIKTYPQDADVTSMRSDGSVVFLGSEALEIESGRSAPLPEAGTGIVLASVTLR
jgi:hypothetical protein